MIIAKETANVQAWGNSTALRLPKPLANLLDFSPNDEIIFTVEVDSQGKKQLIISKLQEPKTIHELFADYEGGSFSSEIVEFEPMGNELW